MSDRISLEQKQVRRSIFVGAVALLIVLGVFALGKMGWLPDSDHLQNWLESMADSPWGPPALILVFCVGAFLGIPQFALILAAVSVFGPWGGAFYSWIANMVSGTVTFWTGRFAGEKMFKRHAGKTANRLASFVGRNAFVTSAIVRNVPTGPFLLVNMAFGVSKARYSHFAAGMAIGVLPKILLIAFGLQSLLSAIKGHPMLAILTGGIAVAIYALGTVFARRQMERRRQTVLQNAQIDVDTDTQKNE